MVNSELEEIYAGVATLKDGNTVIISGTLIECAEWADRIMKYKEFEKIELKKVKA